MGGKIGVIFREDTEPFIRKQMNQFKGCRGKKGDTEKKDIMVIQKLSCVPGQDENGQEDNHADDFNKAVEQNKGIKAARVKAGTCEDKQISRKKQPDN